MAVQLEPMALGGIYWALFCGMGMVVELVIERLCQGLCVSAFGCVYMCMRISLFWGFYLCTFKCLHAVLLQGVQLNMILFLMSRLLHCSSSASVVNTSQQHLNPHRPYWFVKLFEGSITLIHLSHC